MTGKNITVMAVSAVAAYLIMDAIKKGYWTLPGSQQSQKLSQMLSDQAREMNAVNYGDLTYFPGMLSA
jgi:hypothetical protein